MPDPEELDESGGAKATPDKTTTISESTDYGNEPPRLLMGINDAPVQAPDGAVFRGSELVEHKLEGHFDAEKLMLILKTIRARLDDDFDAVWKTQEKPIAAWRSDPDEERWAQRFSECYVGITYGGPGQSYFGGGNWDPYIFSRVQPKMRKMTCYEYPITEGNTVKPAKRGATQVGSWKDPEVFEIKQERPPATGYLGDWETNDDPAIPLIGACQQTTSYGAVAHGFTVEDDLQYAGYAASEHSGNLPIFTGKKPNGMPGEPVSGGKFFTVGGRFKPKKEDKAQTETKPEKDEKDKDEIQSLWDLRPLLDPAFATDSSKVDPPMAPGTIITYNPHGFLTSVQAIVTDFENENRLMKVRAEICRVIQGDPNANHPYKPPARDRVLAPLPTRKVIDDWLRSVTLPGIPMRKKDETKEAYTTRKEEWDATQKTRAARYLSQRAADDSEDAFGRLFEIKLDLPTSVQDPGSHICFVLRVSPEKDPAERRVQLFDTSSNTAYWVMEQQARRGVIARPLQGGIMDGCGIPSSIRKNASRIPSNSPMVGIGVTPKPDLARLNAQLVALGHARPIGLVRLVLTVRKPPEKPKPPSPWAKPKPKTTADDLGPDLFPQRFQWGAGIQPSEVLYISRLLRMYGDKPNQNFYLSKLLRSLRATPFFTNIQAWWFVYIPTGLFAKSMWARDGREMRPRDFVKTVLPLPKYYDKVTPSTAIPDPYTKRTDLKAGTHYRLTHVLTATGSDVPGRVAKAFTWCRLKSSLSDSGDTSLRADGFDVPKEINKMIETLGVADEFVSSRAKDAVPPPDDGRAGTDELDYFRYG